MKKNSISVLAFPDATYCLMMRGTIRRLLVLLTMGHLALFASHVNASEPIVDFDDSSTSEEPYTSDLNEPSETSEDNSSVFEETSVTSSADDMAGGFFGIGFYQGKSTFNGPTIALTASRSNIFKIAAPVSFNNVIVDYQYLVWDPFDHPFQRFFRFNLYFGLGSNVSFKDPVAVDVKEGEAESTSSSIDIRAAARIPIGFGIRFVSIPIEAFIEIAPSVEFFDGSEFSFEVTKVTVGKVAVGGRFYF